MGIFKPLSVIQVRKDDSDGVVPRISTPRFKDIYPKKYVIKPCPQQRGPFLKEMSFSNHIFEEYMLAFNVFRRVINQDYVVAWVFSILFCAPKKQQSLPVGQLAFWVTIFPTSNEYPPKVSQLAPENLPKPIRKRSSSNHHFSGAMLNFRWVTPMYKKSSRRMKFRSFFSFWDVDWRHRKKHPQMMKWFQP